ncbi:transglutaminase-like cysteine peptidase [Chelatococcus sp. SYSU_G07232]|uniref:Transglutaminase-like cysteine peptidase n=1 Tax=Chelatococcus albus TaxID=3047466 RepID=A0ABT7AJ33_9HYPH|nr:transglutaminase-like cysteine peptidase [Chelatococcus sp. SYSU_G07232]MDJ1159393.1 transglutaminase-like cysteine peptidase [Chelatococcus sp. SYSU_G07232]
MAAVAAAMVMAGGAWAANVLPVASAPVMPGDVARSPIGWIDFCRRHAGECDVDSTEPDRIRLTPAAWKQLQAINNEVNAAIEPVTDEEHFGVVESWDFPDDGKGDCEDFALLKRRKLAAAGFPRRALLMTVVLDEQRAGHAVLMVRTDRGDFILDNKRDTILPWTSTGYVYIKRESQIAAGWVSLGRVGSETATAAR